MFGNNRQTLCKLASQYLDVEEQIKALVGKKQIPSSLLELYQDKIKTCKVLGDLAYLNQLLIRK